MDSNYDVGYKKPPKAAQFKAGQSGNPKGRPKGSQNLGKMLNDELSEIITVKENGVIRKITKRQALSKHWVNNAIKGDYKAAKLVLKHLKELPEIEPFEIIPEDDAALEKLKSRVKASLLKQEPDRE